MTARFWGVVLFGGVLALATGAVMAFVLRDSGASRFSGNDRVDSIVEAIEAGDLTTLLEQVRYQSLPCSSDPVPDPNTLLAPPLCPEGERDGAMVDAFMTGNCEAGWITPDGILSAFADRLSDEQQVFAVVEMERPFSLIVAQFRIVFGLPGQREFPFSGHMALFDGDVVQLMTWCGSAFEQIASLEAAGGEVVYLAPGVEPEAAVRAR